MAIVTIRQIWNIFYKELSIITWAGFIFILTTSVVSFMYFFGFILELPQLQSTQGKVESISNHISYSSRYHSERTHYEANIQFSTGDSQIHTFQSFAIGRSNIGTEFTVLYRIDDFEGMKAYTIPDLILLGIFFVFICIAPLPIYLMIIDYVQKKISRLIGRPSMSIFRTGMIIWFICVYFSLFGGGLIWTYYDGNVILFLTGVVLMFIVGKNLITSIRKIKNQ